MRATSAYAYRVYHKRLRHIHLAGGVTVGTDHHPPPGFHAQESVFFARFTG